MSVEIFPQIPRVLSLHIAWDLDLRLSQEERADELQYQQHNHKNQIHNDKIIEYDISSKFKFKKIYLSFTVMLMKIFN